MADNQEAKRRNRGVAVVLAALFMVVGGVWALGASNRDDETADLRAALCADLDAGLTVEQLYRQGVAHYRETGRGPEAARLAAAEMFDKATSDDCPRHRDEFTGSVAYRDWIAPQG